MGQKSTWASHHLYGLCGYAAPLALTTTSSRIEDEPTSPNTADTEEGGGTVFSFLHLHFSFPVRNLIHVVEFSTAADLTEIKSGLLLRLRGYLKKIKMADLLIGICLSSGQMCGESKRRQINFASHFNAASSDL